MGLKRDGSVWAWGGNGSGELGNNSIVSSKTPVKVKDVGSSTGYLESVAAIASRGNYTVAVKKNGGTVWAWGKNAGGQLGNNSTISSKTPVKVKDAGNSGHLGNITAIAAGNGHTIALKDDGTIWA